jgi:signal transduction histidine kinase
LGRRARTLLAVAALVASCALALPAPGALGGRRRWIEAPLDPGLRVPVASALFGLPVASVGPGLRVLGAELPAERRVLPRDRRALYAALRGTAASALLLDGVEGRERRTVRVVIAEETGWARASRAWPLAVIVGAFLLFALAVGLGSAHASAPPLFLVSWCVGAAALAELDRLLPELPGALAARDLASRVGVLAWTLLPAAILHLAMRFPVVSARFRSARAAALPYASALPLVASGQLHLRDAAFQASLERIALGATLAAALLLVAASATAARRLRPIERARTGAWIAGLGLGVAGPVALAVAPGRIPAAAALTLLALPGALAWAGVRYGLLDPGARLGRVARASAHARLLERAVRELARRTSPPEVLARTAALARAELGGAPVVAFGVPEGGEGPESALAASGLSLWRSAGAPTEGVVHAGARAEDPAPERAELVAALGRAEGPTALLVAGGRPSGLPYSDAEQRLLEGLCCVSATALAAAATAADLEARVREKTAVLARGLRDRQRVLETAEGICAADDREEVLARLAAFAGGEDPDAGVRDPERARELGPQLEALRAFARLALARLELLAELKCEVERQAAELGEIRSRRLHAEFVRGVAHELRKPLAELRRRVEGAERQNDPAMERSRLRALARELDRRLDLLLFHSGVRLERRRMDLARLVDDAVIEARAATPDRDFWVFHEPPMLPILGDPGRLLSVIENLLDNAIKATRVGQRITLRSRLERSRDASGPRAVLEVEDPGSGIDAEHAARVFEPGVAFAPGGFGLGLSLCREIVRLHGGTIVLDSRPGCTLFRVRIPLFGAVGAGDP